jgi:hypothetical protein
MLSRAFQGPDRVVSLGGRHIKMCKLERLPKWLLAVALFFGLSSGPAFAQYTPVGGDIFSFNNIVNVNSGLPVLNGFLTGTGGNITGFRGNLVGTGGGTIDSFTGLYGGYGGTYSGTPGAYDFTAAPNFSVISGSNTYTFGAFSRPTGSAGSYTVVGTLQKGTSLFDTSTQSYSAIATPEIDGSVVPKAGFVIAGLFWLLMQRRRQGASLDV